MTKSLTVNQENTAASRGFLTTGVGFVADVLSLLDVFDDMPDIEDVATEVYEHWEEEMKYLEEILEGQLEIKDLINDVIEMGEQMEQDILDALETGLNDINGQINDVDDHIEQMQEDILQAMSAFYEAVMVQFEEVKLNQQYMTAQLKAIEEMLMEISGEVEKLSAKIDWDGVVSLSGVHIQRIEYLYDSLSHIPQVEEGDGGYVDSPVIDADQVNYFRLRQWATSVMDYNNGTPLAEDALDRLIMGKMILTNSMINLLIKLLQQDAFPTGGRSRTQVVQEYYENLAMIQVKGFMCVDVACNILRIRNPYEELVEQRINDQLDFVVAALDESGFDPLELIPAPTEGDRKTVYYGDKADHSLSIDLADPAMGLDNPEEWCILNMIPFIDDARKGEVSVCVGKLLPGYKIDYATVEWMDYKTSDADPFWLEHAASAISGAGSIFADAVRIPDERIASCFTFAYISNQITIKATHNPYDPELGTWDSSLPATEEATGSRTVSEGSLGYWLNNPVSSVSDLPLMALGFLVSTNDTENCLEVSFQTSRVGGEALPPLPEIESPVRQEYKDSPQTGAAEYGSVDESSAYFEYDTEGTFTVHLERSGLTDYTKYFITNIKPIVSEEGVVEVCVAKLNENFEMEDSQWVTIPVECSNEELSLWPTDFFFSRGRSGGNKFQIVPTEVSQDYLPIAISFKILYRELYTDIYDQPYEDGNPGSAMFRSIEFISTKVDPYTREWIPGETHTNTHTPYNELGDQGNAYTDYFDISSSYQYFEGEPVSDNELKPLCGLTFRLYNGNEALGYSAAKWAQGS